MHLPKQALSKDKFSKADDRSFLAAVDKVEPAKLSHGMWQKMYALLANQRAKTKINYCIYTGDKYEYDTANRTYWPVVGAQSMRIDVMLTSKAKR